MTVVLVRFRAVRGSEQPAFAPALSRPPTPPSRGAVIVLADGWTSSGMTVLPPSARDAIADKCSAVHLLYSYRARETGMKKCAWSYQRRRSPQQGSGGDPDLVK